VAIPSPTALTVCPPHHGGMPIVVLAWQKDPDVTKKLPNFLFYDILAYTYSHVKRKLIGGRGFDD
jgi:hypothetical protein